MAGYRKGCMQAHGMRSGRNAFFRTSFAPLVSVPEHAGSTRRQRDLRTQAAVRRPCRFGAFSLLSLSRSARPSLFVALCTRFGHGIINCGLERLFSYFSPFQESNERHDVVVGSLFSCVRVKRDEAAAARRRRNETGSRICCPPLFCQSITASSCHEERFLRRR